MTGKETLVTVSTVTDLRQHVSSLRTAGVTIALVPTMGALHDGHLSLVRAAREQASHVVVSLFVNPTQFGENEDLDTYPGDRDRDRALLSDENVDLLFMPRVEDMYPEGDVTRITVGDLGSTLEGEYRPGFFIGVATVVSKLLLQVLPDVALFGEKDFQQLQVIRRMVRDLHIPVRIFGVPTVRAPDGLALSSRNAYLSDAERAVAPALYEVLTGIAGTVRKKGDIPAALNMGRASLLSAGFAAVDYLECRHAETFTPVTDATDEDPDNLRVLAAVRLGSTRLIDNVSI